LGFSSTALRGPLHFSPTFVADCQLSKRLSPITATCPGKAYIETWQVLVKYMARLPIFPRYSLRSQRLCVCTSWRRPSVYNVINGLSLSSSDYGNSNASNGLACSAYHVISRNSYSK